MKLRRSSLLLLILLLIAAYAGYRLFDTLMGYRQANSYYATVSQEFTRVSSQTASPMPVLASPSPAVASPERGVVPDSDSTVSQAPGPAPASPNAGINAVKQTEVAAYPDAPTPTGSPAPSNVSGQQKQTSVVSTSLPLPGATPELAEPTFIPSERPALPEGAPGGTEASSPPAADSAFAEITPEQGKQTLVFPEDSLTKSIDSSPETPADSGEEASEAAAPRTTDEQPPIAVDFDRLLRANPDVVAWIYCEDTPIHYPVLRGKDNDQYLHRLLDGAYSNSGSIFMDSVCQPDFSDDNSVLYGHHMRDGSMFACLARYQKPEFFDEHPVMWLLTPEEDYKIELFAGLVAGAGNWIYSVHFGEVSEKEDFLRRVLDASSFLSPVTPTTEDRLITLSTCAYEFEGARYVVLGILSRVVPPEPVDNVAPLP